MADGLTTRRAAGWFASPLSRRGAALLLALATVFLLALDSVNPAAAAYVYDGAGPSALVAEATPADRPSDQGVLDCTSEPGDLDGNYDDRANLARAPSRVDAYRVAPRAIATGQEHHVISRRIAGALDDHPALAGQYTPRDPRFVTRAADAAAHRGYQTWHRQLDAEVVDWLARNPNATTTSFERFLQGRYGQADLLERFPNGF